MLNKIISINLYLFLYTLITIFDLLAMQCIDILKGEINS